MSPARPVSRNDQNRRGDILRALQAHGIRDMAINTKGMNESQFWLLTALSALALILVLICTGLFFDNRSTQAEVNARQQYINQTVQLGQLNTQVAQFLANLAVQTNDQRIRELLAANGITITERPAETPVETPGPAPLGPQE